MSIIAWIIIGLASGFIGSKVVGKAGEGFILDMIVGMVGAVGGGLLFDWVAGVPLHRFDWRSAFVATIGAIALLWMRNTIRKPAPM